MNIVKNQIDELNIQLTVTVAHDDYAEAEKNSRDANVQPSSRASEREWFLCHLSREFMANACLARL